MLFVGSLHALAADPNKVLRLATDDIDTLDPHQLQDKFSQDIASVIFEGMFEWDYLNRPAQPVPRTATAAPAISPDGRTWTVRIKPGIHFTPDPAFKGQRRELQAQDYVYSIKRALDPNLRGGGYPEATDLIAGMRAVVDAARKPGAKMSYDANVAGLRALDRHTLQFTFTDVNFPIANQLLLVPAVAREVVEAAKGDIQSRAIGTGPYVLKEWQRGSRVVLEANAGYRPLTFPEGRTPEMARISATMKGRKLPAIGRIVLSVIDEQPVRLLEFDRGKLDLVELRGEAVGRFLKGGELDPALVKRGIKRVPYATNSVRSLYANMDDPVIGGTSRERLALRRAIGLAIDVDTLIKVVYLGQGLPAAQIVAPGIAGHNAAFTRKYDPAGSAALLDKLGYDKRDAQGFRLQPDGKPLTVTLTIFTGNVWREIQTLIKKNMDTLGVRFDFRNVPVQDLFKEAAQGKFMMNIHGRSASPDGIIFSTFYGPSPPEANESRFRNAQYDEAYREFLRARNEADRQRAADTMSEVLITYAPVLPLLVDVENAFVQPWVMGYVPARVGAYWYYYDIAAGRPP